MEIKQREQAVAPPAPARTAIRRPIPAIVRQEQQQCPSSRKSLLSLCVSCLGSYLHDIVDDIYLVAPFLPPTVKLKLVAIARRRGLLCDKLLVPLADSSWEILDVSGSDVTDSGVCSVAQVCPMLKAVDVSRCNMLTTQSIRELVEHCPALVTLRCGGTRLSNKAAKESMPYLLPRLDVEKEVEDSWEDLETASLARGAQSLRWIVWPCIDQASMELVEAQCPRLRINPQARDNAPREALADAVLDMTVVEDIEPSTWAVRTKTVVTSSATTTECVHIAERFRLAFVARDERLAPKRAKNWRQNQRRSEKAWLSSESGHLAAVLDAEW